MALLRQRNLISPLLEFSRSGRPLMGICLGMQLLMSESLEFGRHAGLDIIPGIVTSLALCDQDGSQLKVPNIGWSRVNAVKSDWPDLDSFKGSPLEGLESGEFMYFVHSFHCVPEKADVVVAKSQHGTHEFVCAVRSANVFGYQFHPEKSGPRGLDIYRKFGAMVKRGTSRQEAA
jgi:glutamine amidotransferase